MDIINIIFVGIGFSLGCLFTGLFLLILSHADEIRKDTYGDE